MSSIVEENINSHCEQSKAIQNKKLDCHANARSDKKSNIPDGWNEVKLGNICDVTAGGTPSTTKLEYWNNGNIPWMNSGEINLKQITDVEGRITDLGLKSSSTKLLPENSVLVALAGQGTTRGKVAVNKIKLCTNQSIAAYLLDNKKLSYKYLYYNLDSRYNELRLISSGDGTRGGLNLSILKSLKIKIPKQLKEQEAIADILSGADEVIEVTKAKIDLLKLRKKSLMQKLLAPKPHWVEKKLRDIGTFSKGNGISKDEVLSEGLPCIRYGEIYTSYDFVINEFKSFINKESAENSRRLCENDLLFAGSGETKEEIGKCVSFNKTIEAYAGGDIIIYSPNKEKYKSYFLSYFLNTFGRRQLNKLGQGDSVVHIYKSHLENIKIPLPPTTEEQDQIAFVLSTCDEEIKLYEQKLKTLEKQKKGLMQKLLTGKWRVPN